MKNIVFKRYLQKKILLLLGPFPVSDVQYYRHINYHDIIFHIVIMICIFTIRYIATCVHVATYVTSFIGIIMFNMLCFLFLGRVIFSVLSIG